MSARVNLKPLMHWLIYRHYTVRISERAATQVAGIITTPDGMVNFRYDPVAQIVHLPDKSIAINDYGWEVEA
jgi:hypothetical protein